MERKCPSTTSFEFLVLTENSALFLISAIVQVLLARHHKKEKRFGPSPANNYTRGSGAKFWQRRRKNRGVRDPEMVGSVPGTTATGTTGTLAPGAHDYRPSHDTAYTGTTAARESATYDSPHKPLAGGYHTAPTGTYHTGVEGAHGTHNPPYSHTPATNY